MEGGREPAVVLLSGGLDSTTTLHVARARGFAVHALTFDYGQRHRLEIDAARKVAAAAGVASHRVLALDPALFLGSALVGDQAPLPRDRPDAAIGAGIPPTYVPARNTVFLALALALGEGLGARDLFLGANVLDSSGYPDCRPDFLAAFERVANLGTRAVEGGRPWRVHAPLIDLDKAGIVRLAVELGVDLAATLSCYDPASDGRPCGHCDACRLRRRGFERAGVADPAADARSAS